MKQETWSNLSNRLAGLARWFEYAGWVISDKVLHPLAVYAGNRSRRP